MLARNVILDWGSDSQSLCLIDDLIELEGSWNYHFTFFVIAIMLDMVGGSWNHYFIFCFMTNLDF